MEGNNLTHHVNDFFPFQCAIGTNINSDEAAGGSVLALWLAKRFQDVVCAPDIGTQREGMEFGRLCYDAIVNEKQVDDGPTRVENHLSRYILFLLYNN